MEFRFSDEQLEIQQRIRDCCGREIAPGAADLDAASVDKAEEMIAARAKMLAQEGLLGLGIPEDRGGTGGDLLSSVVLYQELGEACPATALSVLASAGLCARALCDWGETPEQEALLKDLVRGQTLRKPY
jgi:alkylation response protein AidB-like acyl-CoA dehydrogenase